MSFSGPVSLSFTIVGFYLLQTTQVTQEGQGAQSKLMPFPQVGLGSSKVFSPEIQPCFMEKIWVYSKLVIFFLLCQGHQGFFFSSLTVRTQVPGDKTNESVLHTLNTAPRVSESLTVILVYSQPAASHQNYHVSLSTRLQFKCFLLGMLISVLICLSRFQGEACFVTSVP